MPVKIIYFVHGTTYDNANSICSGWKQAKLNDLGKNQAKELGKNNKYTFDVIFTSDLIRAIDSAEIAFSQYEKIIDTRLRECNYGDYDGRDKKFIIYENYIENSFPNGESLLDVENRMRKFLIYLKENYDNKTVGIVAHRAPQLALDVIIKNITWKDAIQNDWRKTGNWKPGWEYILK